MILGEGSAFVSSGGSGRDGVGATVSREVKHSSELVSGDHMGVFGEAILESSPPKPRSSPAKRE